MRVYVAVCIVHLEGDKYPEVLGVHETQEGAEVRMREDRRTKHEESHEEWMVVEVELELGDSTRRRR